ncbi:NAC domain-containing protein 41-like [Mercurialis annua]|uniref:NAC domain-containing protein 41-like n=1 Tax=Mercurialis annua TaxID=3986 RepID=UPI002160AD73|nr:NAC domain-containing protein 41-like [Mercurialis annua]
MKWFSGCPPGIRFCPKDDELFCHYLYGKIKGLAFSPLELSLVQHCDLYGDHDPWTIWENFGGESSTFMDDLFFFTQLKKKSSAKRFGRTVGRNGTWSGEGKGDEFELGNVKGLKKRFHYDNSTVAEQDGRWIMHEYSLPEESANWVLCLLRKNDAEKKKRKRDQSVKQRKPSKRQALSEEVEAMALNMRSETGPRSTNASDGCANGSDSCALQLCPSSSFGYNSAQAEIGDEAYLQQQKSALAMEAMWMQSANASYEQMSPVGPSSSSYCYGGDDMLKLGGDEDGMWHLLDDFWEQNIGIDDLLD